MERYGSEEEFFSAMDERAQEDSEMAAKEADGQAAAYEAQRETDNISFGKSEDCPYCPNQGWYFDGDPEDPEQTQCEWCWTTPNSKFNVERGQQ